MLSEPNIPGYFSPDQLNFLYEVVSDIKPRNAVEIGCYMGRSTYAISKAMNENNGEKLICVDSWRQKVSEDYFNQEHMKKLFSMFPDAVHNYRRTEFDSIMDLFKITLERFPFMRDLIEIRNTDSKNVDLTGEEIDLSFIDGDHTYEGTKNDIMKVLDGARFPIVMAFHDYSEKAYPGVVKAIHELTQWKRSDRLGLVGHTIAFRVHQ